MSSVHENDNYMVVVNKLGVGYEVINKNYNVLEFEAISLPECIFAAENLNVVLTHQTWRWVSRKADAQAAEDQKSAAKATGLSLLN